MSEKNVYYTDPEVDARLERIDTGRLSLIGCVDLEWITGKYPLLLFTTDQTLRVQPVHYDNHSIYRVHGLMPTYTDPEDLR